MHIDYSARLVLTKDPLGALPQSFICYSEWLPLWHGVLEYRPQPSRAFIWRDVLQQVPAMILYTI